MPRDSIRVSEYSTTSDRVIIIFHTYCSIIGRSIIRRSIHLSSVLSINCRFYLLSFYVLSYTAQMSYRSRQGQHYLL